MKRLFAGRYASTALVACAALTACSGSTTPPTSGVGASAYHTSRVRPATACPGGGLTVQGDIGTYSVGIGDTCVLYGQDNQVCLVGELAGYTYNFYILSGEGHGTLTGNGSKSTFKRTSAGNVDIVLKQLYSDPVDGCKFGGDSTYGSVTLD